MPAEPAVPLSEIQQRLLTFQGRLSVAAAPVDLALIIQNTDLYYLAGTVQTGHLLVPAQGDCRLLIRKVLERAREDSPLDAIAPMTSLKALPDEIEKICGKRPWRIGMELDVLPANLLGLYRRVLGEDVEIVDVSRDLLAVRSVKSEWEIDALRAAGRINDSLYRELPALIEPGMTTYDLQSALNCHACRQGHVGLVRMRGFNIDGLIGIVVSGPTGSVPGHSQFPIGGQGPSPVIAHGGDHLPIDRDVPIIFDYLANNAGYHHDQTRMAVLGRLPDDARRIYEAMQELLHQVESSLQPGAIPSRIYEEVLARVAELGLADGFLGPPGYAVNFVGHSVGLEVNETPVLARKFDEPLVEGNTLAVEPKFTHSSYGVIGIENTFVIRAAGAENLGSTPENVLEIG
jgi:Xaa-Pro aminopeptidase